MKRKKTFFCAAGMPHLLLLLLVPFMAMGQRGKAVKYYERAESALTKGNGAEAERMLKQAIEADSTLLEAHLMLAEWLLDAGRKEESLQHYAAVTRQNATFHTPAWLEQGKLELDAAGNFARVQSFTGASDPAGAPVDLGTGAPNYDKAIYCFQRFLELDKRAPKRRGEAERGIETARFRKEAVANPVEFNPINLGAAVNSADDEYLPALTVDGGTLIFTRRFPRRATTTANTPKEEDLYFYWRQMGETPQHWHARQQRRMGRSALLLHRRQDAILRQQPQGRLRRHGHLEDHLRGRQMD